MKDSGDDYEIQNSKTTSPEKTNEENDTQQNAVGKIIAAQEAEDLISGSKPLSETELKEKPNSKKARKKREKHAAQSAKIRKIAIFSVLGLILIALIAFFCLNFAKTKEKHESGPDLKEPEAVVAPTIYYSHLTGKEVADENALKAPATCVMIENSPAARPQSGLSKAGVVYESIAEGGITRFMAIFQGEKPAAIGPVRSVRLTFAQLAKPYNCAIAHVGGADNAIEHIRATPGFRDVDQFANGSHYSRQSKKPGTSTSIYAPHNVYTTGKHLDSLNYNKGYQESVFNGFLRVDPETESHNEGATAATNITINISSKLYNPHYIYNPESKLYLREQGGKAHIDLDENGKSSQNSPRVVIAMKANAVPRGSTGYQDYTVIGSNDAFIFQNGIVTAGKWKRSSENDELKFFDNNGEEIALEAGQVWISVYPSNSGSVNWQ